MTNNAVLTSTLSASTIAGSEDAIEPIFGMNARRPASSPKVEAKGIESQDRPIVTNRHPGP
jgi:hypothetical protein